MKQTICFLLITAAISCTVFAESRRYSITPNDASRLELHVFKTGLYHGRVHTFLFPVYTANLVYNAATPNASAIELNISAGSIQCVDTWLKAKDLKSVQEYAVNDMLAAERYPEIRFTSSEIRAIRETRFEVRGMLAIRGIAKPSTIDVTLHPDSRNVLTFRGSSIVRLSDYGLKPPKAALGTIGTKNEMEFTFTLQLNDDVRP
jgi:polyisoprenoid-binding protein YceI